MNQKFEFTGKTKLTLMLMMLVGVICMAWTYFAGGPEAEVRFWTNFLHNSVFFTGIAFTSFLLLAAKVIAYSGWQTVFKRVLESYSLFMFTGLILMLVVLLGLYLDWHHLYHWAFKGVAEEGTATYDTIIAGKSGFLNPVFYTIATVGFLGMWYLFARRFRNLSLKEDAQGTKDYKIHRRMKILSAVFLPLAGFTSCAAIWQWVMSLDSHWYSTLFAWYSTISWLVAAVAFWILTIIYLKSKGYFAQVSSEHLHDLGKYLFGFSIFWTYLWFSQFMLIWYANVGEETIYFDLRMSEYPYLFFLNLGINFLIPFFILMRNDTKKKFGSLIFVSIVVIFGHWLDYFLMIKPGALHTAHEYHELMHPYDTHDDTHGHEEGHGSIFDFENEGTAILINQDQDETQGEDNNHSSDADHTDHDADHSTEGSHSHDEEAHSSDSDGHHDNTHHGDEDHHHAGDATSHEEDHAHDGHDHGHGHHFLMGFHFPGILEIGTMIGFLGLFLFIGLTKLSKANLIPKNDPYLDESLHHHVGYGGGNPYEGDGHGH